MRKQQILVGHACDSLVPGSVTRVHLRCQDLVRLLKSLDDRQFPGNDRRHQLAYLLARRLKLRNAHILHAMIGNWIERGLIWSSSIDRVERDLGKGSRRLVIGILVNRSPCAWRHVGPTEGLPCQL